MFIVTNFSFPDGLEGQLGPGSRYVCMNLHVKQSQISLCEQFFPNNSNLIVTEILFWGQRSPGNIEEAEQWFADIKRKRVLGLTRCKLCAVSSVSKVIHDGRSRVQSVTNGPFNSRFSILYRLNASSSGRGKSFWGRQDRACEGRLFFYF